MILNDRLVRRKFTHIYECLGETSLVERASDTEPQFANPARSGSRILIFLSQLNRPLTITLEQGIALTLACAVILTRLIGLGERVMSHDESLHVYYSWLLATGKGFIHTPMMHGPFLFESTALINILLGANDFTSRLIPLILGSFIAIVIPQLLKPWLGRSGTLIASLLFLISPYVLYYSRYIRHDILVIAWMLLAVYSIFGYLFQRKERYLVIFVAALALMFSTMEITFIYLAIFASYLLVRIGWKYGVRWKVITTSPEFDLLVLMVTLGAFFSSTIALPIINLFFSRLTGAAFVDLSVLGSQGTEWMSNPSGVRLWALFGVFSVVSTGLGIVWGSQRWLKLACLFLGIDLLLFTTFFTNPTGIASGFIGSLGYWLSQQGVARGGQPWYYFLIVFPIYEYLPLIGGIGAAILFFIRRKQLPELARNFIPFALWWAAGIFLALSLAGEKMPWLSTHITVPFLLLAAWWIGQMVEGIWVDDVIHSKPKGFFKRMGLVAIGIVTLLTMRTSFFVNYINYDDSTEYIDYAHGAPGVKWVLDDIQSIATHTGTGEDLKIAYDSDVSWPMSWYLKDYPNSSFYGSQPNREALDAPVVLAGPSNWNKVELMLGSRYHRFEVIRMWWPIEDYKNLTWGRIRKALANPDLRAALWDILWKRDYTRYSSLTGTSLKPPTDWPLAEKMRVYVRKDIALQMLSLSLGPSVLADIPQQADAYVNIQKTIKPEFVITTGELNTPRNLAISRDGSIYVVDSGNSRIAKYNSQGELLLSWGSRTPDGQSPPAAGTLNEPWGIALDGDGNVLVADTWNHRIQKFDSQGKFVVEWGSSGLASDGLDRLWGPRGIAVASDGRLYVTDAGNKRVVVFSSEGTALFEFATGGDGQLDEPVGIALGPEGYIYVADTWNMRVVVFSPEGKYISSFNVQGWGSSSVDNKPYLSVGPDNRIYLTDPEGYRVIVFSASGEPLAAFGQYGPEDGSFGLPNGLALGPDGSLWIVDAGNNRVVKYPPIQP